MKNLSLKLDDDIYEDADKMTARLNIARNRYINDAVNFYNLLNKRRLLKAQLTKESKLVRKESMNVLGELERLIDEED